MFFIPLSRRRTASLRGALGVGLLSTLSAGVPSSACAQAAPIFPYVAYVIEADAQVRSGPGESYLATSRLPLGYAVEVYRHDADGMCAVRPPEGSFSLVPSSALQILDQRTAEVLADGVAARVGSQLTPDATAVQVLLGRGETVELLAPHRGELLAPHGGETLAPHGGDAWVRIAPPAGEFRWLSARHIARTPPVERAIDARRTPAHSAENLHDAWRPLNSYPGNRPSANKAGKQPSTGGNAFAHLSDAPGAFGLNLQRDTIVHGSPADVQLAQFQQSSPTAHSAPPLLTAPFASAGQAGVGPSSHSRPARVRFPGRAVAAGAAGRAKGLADLELLLSQTVVQHPSQWQLAGLRAEAAAQLANAGDVESRTGLRDLLERIALFEKVAASYATPLASAPLGHLLPNSSRNVDPFAGPGPGSVGGRNLSTSNQPLSAGVVAPSGGGDAPSASSSDTSSSSPATTEQGGGVARDSVSGEAITSQSEALAARIRADLGEAGGPIAARRVGAGGVGGLLAADERRGSDETARFDAVGKLRPVYSQRRGAPQFALVDDQGVVVSFLTPSPDLNLHAYLGQKIGVIGERGFMPEYRQAHVVAGRVTPLAETTRR